MWNNNPLNVQAKKNALGSLMSAGTTPAVPALAPVSPSNPPIANMTANPMAKFGGAQEQEKLNPSYVKHNKLGIGKLFNPIKKTPVV